jgi:hypothetical protein
VGLSLTSRKNTKARHQDFILPLFFELYTN